MKEHDYDAALKAFNQDDKSGFSMIHGEDTAKTIRHALRFAEKMSGDEMNNVLIGGNHLASALLGTADPAQYRLLGYYDVLEKHGQPYTDMFVAWKAIMNLRDQALKELGE